MVGGQVIVKPNAYNLGAGKDQIDRPARQTALVVVALTTVNDRSSSNPIAILSTWANKPPQ